MNIRPYLTLPKLKHIIFASALFVCAVAELDSDCIVIHDSEAGAEVIQRVEAELLLPGVEVVNIEVLTLGIILIGEDGALIKRIQTELNGDGGRHRRADREGRSLSRPPLSS